MKDKMKEFNNGKDSSYAYDFFAGIEPSGVYTSRAGRNNRSRHLAHRTIGQIGGFIGGAAAIPAVISGAAVGIPNYIGAGKGRKLSIIAKGAFKPYVDLYHASKARGELSRITKNTTESGIKNIMSTLKNSTLEESERMAKSKMNASKIMINGRYPSSKEGLVLRLLQTDTAAREEAGRQINKGFHTGVASLALAGAVNSGSTWAQYNSARNSVSEIDAIKGRDKIAKYINEDMEMNNEIMQKIAEEALMLGYEEEMESLTKEAAAIPGSKTMWQGAKEMFAAAKGHAGTFIKDPGAALGPQTWKSYVKTPETKGVLGLMKETASKTPKAGAPGRDAYKNMIREEGKAFRDMGTSDILHNNSALKGLGLVAGGTAVAGIGSAGVVNALTPPRKVRVV